MCVDQDIDRTANNYYAAAHNSIQLFMCHNRKQLSNVLLSYTNTTASPNHFCPV